MTHDETIKRCPYCTYKDTVKNFSEWEKDGKQGIIGHTDGIMILRCPQCENPIKYDCTRNLFLRLDQNASFINKNLVKLLACWGILVLLVWLINKVL
jgi:hypothetical protein